jgi:hypothetical protein
MKIEQYITVKSKTNGFGFYHYLHIVGGSGDHRSSSRARYGGEFNFILYYASPEQMEGINGMCERIWCEENNIVYGEGDSIELAYKNYLSKHGL